MMTVREWLNSLLATYRDAVAGGSSDWVTQTVAPQGERVMSLVCAVWVAINIRWWIDARRREVPYPRWEAEDNVAFGLAIGTILALIDVMLVACFTGGLK